MAGVKMGWVGKARP